MAIQDFVLGDLAASQQRQVSDAVTRISLSWTLDAVSQMTVELHDPGMRMFLANYFQVRREAFYKGLVFEIAVTELAQSSGSGAAITLECRRKPIQQLKRNKRVSAIGGVTATDFANIAARAVGLNFVGERTSVQRSVIQVQNATADESVFDVLQTLASEAQFSLFESDGTLYFASQEWLLGRWANISLQYPSPETSPFQILEIPNCRRSDDAETDAEVRFSLARNASTMALRAGMTVNVNGLGEFSRSYLISEAAYEEGQPDPVAISCRTPVKKVPRENQ